ncbi:SDR family NAD(P)-dependent oxidoreductase [Paenibacillus koleovorans]|uniref:SDR family NAD(P)-dependent oxidoreductase n=1 Tax=Paenibacillus koleovorans TaxID=121608 RepID=UPI0013E332F8|nr:glucose 1-dehydrogenase [Paenibacillus koleovorans]
MFTDRLLQGKVAVVTGAAAGLGFGAAKRMAEAGAAVVIADRSTAGEEAAERLRQAGYEAAFAQADVTSEADMEGMVARAEETFGGVDILVNNAGLYPRSMMQDTSVELWDRVMAINLRGAFLASKAAEPALVRRGGGAIVNIGSSHAIIGLPELFAYSVSKGGLLTMTRNMAGSLAKHRIRVNCVNPGWVATEGELSERAAKGQSADWLADKGRALPLGRMQTTDDTAALIVFLASDWATQITGQFIQIDGGKEVTSMFDDRSLSTD